MNLLNHIQRPESKKNNNEVKKIEVKVKNTSIFFVDLLMSETAPRIGAVIRIVILVMTNVQFK